MLKTLMDWLEIQILVRLLIGHQENLENGYSMGYGTHSRIKIFRNA